VQEHGVSSYGYEVKTMVECPRFSDHHIRLIKVWMDCSLETFFSYLKYWNERLAENSFAERDFGTLSIASSFCIVI